MNKYRFGTKEVVAVIVTIVLYVLLEALERYLITCGVLNDYVLDWIRFRVVVTIISAAIFGPIVGVISGLGGALLVDVMFYDYISYSEVITYAISGYLIGRYYSKFNVLAGKFKGMAILDFNIIQVLNHIVCSILFVPLFRFITENENLNDAIVLGAKNAVGAMIGTGIIGTFVMWFVSNKMRDKHKL